MFRQLLLTLALAAYANAHALMADPPQRGILAGSSKFTPDLEKIDGAPKDYFGHFPAGDKTTRPGAGKLSQERAADWKWSLYEPKRPGFRFRAGVCGDLKDKPEHLRGGKYYYDGMVTRTYPQGGIIEVRTAVVAHHNGYIELRVCDVQKCGGEISEACLRSSACTVLNRAPNPECDNGMSKKCGPIDTSNPGRWYIPCTSQVGDNGYDDYLGKYAKFQLPATLSCEHCVLQWFYTTASNCNPPGVVDYFKGPDGPKNWGRCRGQAGALGGFTDVQNTCGEGDIKDQFPEEYYQCADISIEGSGRSRPTPASTPATAPPATAAPATTTMTTSAADPTPDPIMDKSTGVFQYFNFIADGEVVQRFTNAISIDISSYSKVAIEAVAREAVKPVDFLVDGKEVWDESTPPYFLYGNSGREPRYFSDERLKAVLNKAFKLEARWKEERMVATIRMYR